MSSQPVYLIPFEAEYIPSDARLQQARLFLEEKLDHDAFIEFEAYESIMFSCGVENFEEILCPRCNTTIDMEWWFNTVSTMSDNGFQSLDITVSCCKAIISLNEMIYRWVPEESWFGGGFSRFAIRIEFIDYQSISDSLLRQIEQLLGCSFKRILAHE